MNLKEILEAIQEEIANLAVESAKFGRNEAMCKAAAAVNYYEKSKIALKEEELMLQRARNANRPSILLGAMVTKEDRKDSVIYIAEARGMSVEGISPEQAFLNFDDVWTQGEQR